MPSQEHVQSLETLQHKGYSAPVSKNEATGNYEAEWGGERHEEGDLGTLQARFNTYIDQLTDKLEEPPLG